MGLHFFFFLCSKVIVTSHPCLARRREELSNWNKGRSSEPPFVVAVAASILRTASTFVCFARLILDKVCLALEKGIQNNKASILHTQTCV